MEKKITWNLVEIDKKMIRPNPNNPKIRNSEGWKRLQKTTAKFGNIFDGIINADYSLIDGHARLEMYPTGTGRYFMPSEQLNEDDEAELNALFDYAQAGDPDLFMIEQILGDEAMEEWDGEEKVDGKKVEKEAKYPLVPQFDEKYEAIIILCTNSIDTTFIENALQIDKAMSYKNKMVKKTSVVTAKKFIQQWNSKLLSQQKDVQEESQQTDTSTDA